MGPIQAFVHNVDVVAASCDLDDEEMFDSDDQLVQEVIGDKMPKSQRNGL